MIWDRTRIFLKQADNLLVSDRRYLRLLQDRVPGVVEARPRRVSGMGREDAVTLRNAVPRQGLATAFLGGTLRDLARDVVAIAQDGLRARGQRDKNGNDESIHLEPLHAIAAGGPVQAEHWLSRNRSVWHGDVRRIFPEAAI